MSTFVVSSMSMSMCIFVLVVFCCSLSLSLTPVTALTGQEYYKLTTTIAPKFLPGPAAPIFETATTLLDAFGIFPADKQTGPPPPTLAEIQGLLNTELVFFGKDSAEGDLVSILITVNDYITGDKLKGHVALITKQTLPFYMDTSSENRKSLEANLIQPLKNIIGGVEGSSLKAKMQKLVTLPYYDERTLDLYLSAANALYMAKTVLFQFEILLASPNTDFQNLRDQYGVELTTFNNWVRPGYEQIESFIWVQQQLQSRQSLYSSDIYYGTAKWNFLSRLGTCGNTQAFNNPRANGGNCCWLDASGTGSRGPPPVRDMQHLNIGFLQFNDQNYKCNDLPQFPYSPPKDILGNPIFGQNMFSTLPFNGYQQVRNSGQRDRLEHINYCIPGVNQAGCITPPCLGPLPAAPYKGSWRIAPNSLSANLQCESTARLTSPIAPLALAGVQRIRLELQTVDCLNVAEVVVVDSTGKNWALSSAGASATQSSFLDGIVGRFPATNLINSNLADFAHTSCSDKGWFEIKLADAAAQPGIIITKIGILNRQDDNIDILERLSGVKVTVYAKDNAQPILTATLTSQKAEQSLTGVRGGAGSGSRASCVWGTWKVDSVNGALATCEGMFQICSDRSGTKVCAGQNHQMGVARNGPNNAWSYEWVNAYYPDGSDNLIFPYMFSADSSQSGGDRNGRFFDIRAQLWAYADANANAILGIYYGLAGHLNGYTLLSQDGQWLSDTRKWQVMGAGASGMSMVQYKPNTKTRMVLATNGGLPGNYEVRTWDESFWNSAYYGPKCYDGFHLDVNYPFLCAPNTANSAAIQTDTDQIDVNAQQQQHGTTSSARTIIVVVTVVCVLLAVSVSVFVFHRRRVSISKLQAISIGVDTEKMKEEPITTNPAVEMMERGETEPTVTL